MSRGASRAAVRALTGDEPTNVSDEVACPMCGKPLDFAQPDPLRIGRQMVQCTNNICPNRALRAVPVRRV